jgi:hypothetical protein
MNNPLALLISLALALSMASTGQTGSNRAEKTRAHAPAGQRGGAVIRFTPRLISEANRKQRYTIKARYPQALGAARDARLIKLNEDLRKFVAKDVADFKADFQAPEEPMGEMGSFYESAYEVNLAADELVSLAFGVSTYGEGAAHPNHSTMVFNYDLAAGRILSLSDLFQPKSNYLGMISSYAIAELKKKLGPEPDTDWIERGAGADAENYQNWNITRQGLKVTFDPYQVASYAEGEHVVIVPYSVLKKVIDPQGLLAGIAVQQKGIRR